MAVLSGRMLAEGDQIFTYTYTYTYTHALVLSKNRDIL